MSDESNAFMAKAQESLAGAESELSLGRYNNCANRCYYACFQGAIAALAQASIRPRGVPAEWSHAFVQAQYVGQLVNRRKIYPASTRDMLTRAFELRVKADYDEAPVTAYRQRER